MKRYSRLLRLGVFFIGIALSAQSRKYDGPRPPKPDVPFILHPGGKLIETEVGEAGQSTEKEFTVFTMKGAASAARTPVPEPAFLFASEKINPDRLSLYRMEIRGSSRVLAFPQNPKKMKDAPRPVFFMVTPLDRSLFKIEVNEVVEPGEFCLSPEGSNQVFCFAIF